MNDVAVEKNLKVFDTLSKMHGKKHSASCNEASPADSSDRKINEIYLSDLGNSHRFISDHGQDLRYCYPWEKWLVWDGQRWMMDNSGEVERRAKETIEKLNKEARAVGNDQGDALLNHAKKSQSHVRIQAMLKLSKSDLSIDPNDLDKDPLRLNLLNGTLNLETGELHPHCREDFITKLAPVDYLPDAECPSWKEHLDLIFQGNEKLIEFLQIAFGYSLTGLTDADAIFISYGSGANGKSVTHETFANILGDYAKRAPTDMLLVKKNGGIPNDLAALKGVRFAYCSEADEGRRLAESLIKDITGGDMISARFMRGEFFTFKPQCKIWLATNHRPVIKGTDHGIWRRLQLIPFTVTIPDDKQLPRSDLETKLRPEYPGILAWAVQGCSKWLNGGKKLPMPDEMKQATEKYRKEMDAIGGFLDEYCVFSPEYVANSGDLYTAYREWCENNDESPISQRGFGRRLAEKEFEKKKGSGGVRQWKGLKLKAVTE